MIYTATCTNPDCTEHGIAKPGEMSALGDGEVIHCGECWQPCQVTEDRQLPADGKAS